MRHVNHLHVKDLNKFQTFNLKKIQPSLETINKQEGQNGPGSLT